MARFPALLLIRYCHNSTNCSKTHFNSILGKSKQPFFQCLHYNVHYTFMMVWMWLGGGEMFHCYHAHGAAHHAAHTGRRLTDPHQHHLTPRHNQQQPTAPAAPAREHLPCRTTFRLLLNIRMNSWYFRNWCLDLVYHQDSRFKLNRIFIQFHSCRNLVFWK